MPFVIILPHKGPEFTQLIECLILVRRNIEFEISTQQSNAALKLGCINLRNLQ